MIIKGGSVVLCVFTVGDCVYVECCDCVCDCVILGICKWWEL
jgi:hypothetical protein